MGTPLKPICLITPPSTFLLDERVFISLGILRVAAVLESRGIPVEHLDLSGITNFEDVIHQHAARSQAEIFGITATTPQMPAARRIGTELRSANPDCRIILGGPHITLVSAARKRENREGVPGRASRDFYDLGEHFDVLVAGDGDLAIIPAIAEDAPSFIDADDPKGPLFLTDAIYEDLPFPARHLVDVDSYHYTIDGERALSMIAELGCPFQCGFCGGRESAMLRRVRTRSSQSVVAEIRHLHDAYGARGIMLYDDELNLTRECVPLMNGIAALGRELGSEFRLRGFVKSELFTDEQAEAMYRAGFRWILVGFESGNARILRNMNKRASLEDNNRCMEIARRNGLKVKALMSVGHPGESEETIADTMNWLIERRPNDFDCTVISCYPGTPYYDQAIQTDRQVWTYTFAKTGDRLHLYDVDYSRVVDSYKGVPGNYRSYVFTDSLTAEDLVSLRDALEKKVRAELGIPFNPGAPGVRFEASMGSLPGHIYRTSEQSAAKV